MRPRSAISIRSEALADIRRLSAEAARQGVETGGFLIGEASGGELVILHGTEPGPDARRTAGSFEPDYVFQARRFRELDAAGRLRIVGAWHAHAIEGLSGGDEETLRRVNGSFPGFLAGIVCGGDAQRFRLFACRGRRIVERRYRVRGDDAVLDFGRVRGLYDHADLVRKHAVIVGLGSGGGVVASLLARAGVGQFSLFDPDTLDRHNLIRHVGKFHQLGMAKADIVRDEILSIDPRAGAMAHRLRIDEPDQAEFVAAVERADAVVACSGDPATNQIANALCTRLRKPAVFAGVFPRGAGGYVLLLLPQIETSPCFNCIFGHARHAIDDSQAGTERLTRQYGLTEDEVAAQQGLFVDVGFVAHLQAKVTLTALLRSARTSLPPLPGNVAVWDGNALTARWATARKRADCAVCNPEGWMQARRSGSAGDGPD